MSKKVYKKNFHVTCRFTQVLVLIQNGKWWHLEFI